MNPTITTPSTQKVRRDVRGGKRGQGHRFQRERRRVRRADPRSIRVTSGERSLTSCAGLVEFGGFLRDQGIDRELAERFGHLKVGPQVVYPMAAQLRLLMDLHCAGEGRVFGLEALAHDPLFFRLAGGSVPCIDTVYTDLERFGQPEIAALEELSAENVLARLRAAKPRILHLDLDTTVAVLFGIQEGALPGPNPRYHGRPSYHPMLMRVAEVQGICGAQLRPGNTAFGHEDVPTVAQWLRRVREAVGPHCLIRVRMDAAGDCTALLHELEGLGVHYYVKAKISQDLAWAIGNHRAWTTVDHDADGKATRQVAQVIFSRNEWTKAGIRPRVVAVRSTERDNGKQIALWADLDYTVQCYLTNDRDSEIDDVSRIYDDRAGIEPIIGELKAEWCIGKAPSAVFAANHAAFLIKILSYNLYRHFLAQQYPALAHWRTGWARRVTILRPGRLVRSGRRVALHTTGIRLPMLR